MGTRTMTGTPSVPLGHSHLARSGEVGAKLGGPRCAGVPLEAHYCFMEVTLT